ncbi:MAG: ABC transporter ATP-binding protein [Clostridia bacterium]|nr:ABC transporter ATP-binding protein [Clostridia bacterium]MDD4386740.1 ABC transporter ATP-binding protein [Clostridia bacterium]
MNIIEVKNFTKNYGNFTAVDDISFEVEKGSLFSFLGPNGAGKSTTINTICTLYKKNSGVIKIADFELGKDDDAIRNKIGVVFQESVLDNLLTVRENIKLRAEFYGIKRKEFDNKIIEMSKVIKIEEFLDRRYGELSGGQKRRADICRALINEPEILFLDEPTTGLDPQTRINVWDTLKLLQKEKGITIFLTTHYMEEAAQSDRVLVIDHGKIIENDTPDNLRIKYSSDLLKVLPKDKDKLIKSLVVKYSIKNDTFIIPVKDSIEALNILNGISDNIEAFEVVRGNMDDVFVSLTGKEIRGE